MRPRRGSFGSTSIPAARSRARRFDWPAWLRHRDDPLVADQLGVDVFVGRRGPSGSRWHAAPPCGQRPRRRRRAPTRSGTRFRMSSSIRLVRVSPASASGETPVSKRLAIGFLQQQRRDQRRQVRIAAALAQPVQRALHLPRARVDRGERVGHGIAGVVMAVDAEPVAGDARGDHLGGDAAHLGRQRAAVGVAEHDPARAGVERGAQAGQRIGGIGAVAVEEMLGVEQRLAPLGDEMARCEAAMASRFSSSVTPSAVVTWKSWVLPTRQTAGVPASRTAASTSSFSADRPTRLVIPKAVIVARVCGRGGERTRCRSGSRPASRPRCSRPRAHRGRAAIWSFSAAENCTPCVCCPSRRVVSKRKRRSRVMAVSTAGHMVDFIRCQDCAVRPALASDPHPRARAQMRLHACRMQASGASLADGHCSASSLAGSKSGPGTSSTPALDMRTSTPAAIRADFRASTAEKSFDAMAVARFELCLESASDYGKFVCRPNSRVRAIRPDRAQEPKQDPADASSSAASRIVRNSCASSAIAPARVQIIAKCIDEHRRCNGFAAALIPIGQTDATCATSSSACRAFSSVQSIGLRVMRHRDRRTGSPRPAQPCSSKSRTVKKLPSDLDIFLPSTCSISLCIQ